MIQEILARSLNVDVGIYKHMVGSFHLYDKDKDFARRFIDEGWQSTKNTMPQMPLGNPWPAIEELQRIEVAIRTNTTIKLDAYDHLDRYWRDLVYLLLVYRFSKVKDIEAINEVSRKVSSDVYRFFIDYKVRQISSD
jgi:thymidylate synthase